MRKALTALALGTVVSAGAASAQDKQLEGIDFAEATRQTLNAVAPHHRSADHFLQSVAFSGAGVRQCEGQKLAIGLAVVDVAGQPTEVSLAYIFEAACPANGKQLSTQSLGFEVRDVTPGAIDVLEHDLGISPKTPSIGNGMVVKWGTNLGANHSSQAQAALAATLLAYGASEKTVPEAKHIFGRMSDSTPWVVPDSGVSETVKATVPVGKFDLVSVEKITNDKGRIYRNTAFSVIKPK